MRALASLLFIICLFSSNKICADDSPVVVTLAPHLTEWVYLLKAEGNLMGVSAHSDYPADAKSKPVIADYQGADIAAILALRPDVVLAWRGGNKPQDIARLRSLDIAVFESSVSRPEDIATEIKKLGGVLGRESLANRIADSFNARLSQLRQQYQRDRQVSVLYYFSTAPLMTVGKHTWPNEVLNVCGAETIFNDSPADYPQVNVQEVLRRQPEILVAAQQSPKDHLEVFWSAHRAVLSAPLLVVDPDVFSRFTPRLLNKLSGLCHKIDRVRQVKIHEKP